MENIKEYKIVTAFSGQDLQNEVNKLIKEGWMPIGGVALNSTNVDKALNQPIPAGIYLTYAQSLIR